MKADIDGNSHQQNNFKKGATALADLGVARGG